VTVHLPWPFGPRSSVSVRPIMSYSPPPSRVRLSSPGSLEPPLVMVTFFGLLLFASPQAQGQARSRWHAEFAAGRSTASGQEFTERKTSAADVLLTRRWMPRAKIAIAASGHVGVTFTNGSSLVCPVAPSGGCVPALPTFTIVGALIGSEWQWQRVTASLRAGPAYIIGNDFERRIPSTLGAEAQTDVAVFVAKHVGLSATLRQTAVPRGSNARIQYRTTTIGIRLQ